MVDKLFFNSKRALLGNILVTILATLAIVVILAVFIFYSSAVRLTDNNANGNIVNKQLGQMFGQNVDKFGMNSYMKNFISTKMVERVLDCAKRISVSASKVGERINLDVWDVMASCSRNILLQVSGTNNYYCDNTACEKRIVGIPEGAISFIISPTKLKIALAGFYSR